MGGRIVESSIPEESAGGSIHVGCLQSTAGAGCSRRVCLDPSVIYSHLELTEDRPWTVVKSSRLPV